MKAKRYFVNRFFWNVCQFSCCGRLSVNVWEPALARAGMFICAPGGGILETAGVFVKSVGQKFSSRPEARSSLWHGLWARGCANGKPAPCVCDRFCVFQESSGVSVFSWLWIPWTTLRQGCTCALRGSTPWGCLLTEGRRPRGCVPGARVQGMYFQLGILLAGRWG